MKTIYIGSTETHIGKSALCMGLATLLKRKGLSVGYMKPVGTYFREVKGGLVDEDAVSFKELLGIAEPLSDISPVQLTQSLFLDALKGKKPALMKQILAAFDRVSAGKDVMLLEGSNSIANGLMYGLSDVHIASALSANMVIMARYDAEYFVDRILLHANFAHTMGLKPYIIFYDIPPLIAPMVWESVAPFLEKEGLENLGIVPHNPNLHAVNASELAARLGGRIIAGETFAEETFVTDYLVGTMTSENALRYFRRTTDSALVVGGDRSYMQVAALDSPIKVLVVTGNLEPSTAVLGKAQEAGKPVIMVREDTMETVERMERVLELVTISDREKLERYTDYIAQKLDVDEFLKRMH